jgi:hypothetical protein
MVELLKELSTPEPGESAKSRKYFYSPAEPDSERLKYSTVSVHTINIFFWGSLLLFIFIVLFFILIE